MKYLTGVPADEPIFVLRAQDLSACQLVALWITLNQHAAPDKLRSAHETLEAMRNWKHKKPAD